MPLPARMPTNNAVHKVGDYGLVQNFPGYSAKLDKTTLVPGTLIAPSKNVVIGSSGRLSQVSGYEIDGDESSVIDSGILSNYDFYNLKSDLRNLRCGFLTSAGNDGKLQFRYVDADGVVSWVNLKTSLSNIRLSFCDYWDNTNLIKYVLWVDGSNNVFKWNGAVTTIASNTATTVTKEGTNTWQQEGFTSTGSIVINGTSYTYSGGYSTTTLTGLTAVPAITAGTETHQLPVTTALSSMTGILATFGPTVIGCGRRNQVYLGASNSNNLYISKVNDFTDYSFTTPGRIAGEGALIPLDAPPNKFIPQEVRNEDNAYDMYISVGSDTWAVIRATLSSDLAKETLEQLRLKVAPLQASQSERLAGKMKNQIMFIGNDNVANFLGYLSDQYVPVMKDFSYPIINDMNSYDFTDGSIYYHRNYIYIAVPREGLIRIYNMTDQTQEQTQYSSESVDNQPWFWEAPVGYPISGFYSVDGELYGHSYVTSESYKLFTGGSFNGQNIEAVAAFAYDDKGDRTQSKASNEIWVEGYIKQNTDLTVTVGGNLDYFATSQTTTIDGSDSSIVAYGNSGGSLGQSSIGSQPLGGSDTITSGPPAWFHVAKTYEKTPYYFEQVTIQSYGVDLGWEIICFGTNATFTNEGNNDITQ